MNRQSLFYRSPHADGAGGKDKPVGTAEESKIAEWKKAHPQGIFSMLIERNDGKVGQIYFCRPNRNHLNYCWTKRDPKAKDEQYLALAEVTYLGGDDTLLKDEQAMITVCAHMETMDVGKAGMILNH